MNINELLIEKQEEQLLEELSLLTEEEFYARMEDDIYEAIATAVKPYTKVQPTNTGDTDINQPLNRTTAKRNYVYKTPTNTRITRRDRQELANNEDPQALKSIIRSAFSAIITAANKTGMASILTTALEALRKRMFKQIDQKSRK